MAETPDVGALVWERLDPLPPTELDDRHRRGGTVVYVDHAAETVTLATTRLEHRGKRQARVIETERLALEAIDVDMTTPAATRWPDRFRLARDLLEAIAQRRASRTGQPDDFDHTALDWARQLWAPTPAPLELSDRAADAIAGLVMTDAELRGHLAPEVVTDDKGRTLGSITRPSRPPAGTTTAQQHRETPSPPTPGATADPAGDLVGPIERGAYALDVEADGTRVMRTDVGTFTAPPPLTPDERRRAAIDRALVPALERLRATP